MSKRTYIIAAALLAVLAVGAHAAETRIYYLGNSLTDELKYDAFVKLAEADGEKVVWGRHMIPGVPIRGLWGAKGQGFQQGPFGHWDKALREFEWDVVTLQPFCPFQGEYEHALLFAQETMKKSPEARICIYAQWPGKGRHSDWDRAFSGPSEIPAWANQDTPTSYKNVAATVPEPLKARFQENSLRNDYELIVLGLRKNVATKQPPVLIPAGHAIQLLGQKMRAGLMPGYQTPWDFYSDGIHVNNDASYLVACAFYATIFGKSPVGLPVGAYQAKPGFRDDCVTITPEMARLIQETVWEVVATHPLTGVASDDSLKIATPLLDSAVAGEPYRCEVLPAFGKGPCAWSVAGGTLPEGLTLSADGVISGVPEKEGTSKLTIRVTDAKGTTALKTFAFVVEKDVAPSIPLQSIPKQTLGTFFERQLTSADGNGIHRWKLKPGEKLPSGLSLDPNGRLWGAPGKRGLHRFAVTVDDCDPARPETAEQTFEVEVGPAASEIAVARRLTEKPKFDPEPDPAQWNFREPIRKLVEGTSATVAGDFDLAWDNEHFWVAVRIKDPTVGKGSWSDKLDRDNVILCLDMLNNREATYNADDRYIVYPRGHLYPQRSIMIGDEFSFGCRQKEIDGGYFALFRVNFRSFGLPPESLPNRVVGLDVMLVDDARQGTARSVVVWQGTKNNAADPSKFGTVVLEE